MNAKQYKTLCREIFRRFKVSQDLLYVDACELADLVLWGEMTHDQLIQNLEVGP